VPSAGSITVDGDDPVARSPRRLHLSDVQPHSRPHRVPERRASAAADQALQIRPP
jgi:hypothetical protein